MHSYASWSKMIRMNSNRSSRILLVLVVAIAAGAGVTGAVTISDHETPAEAKVGERMTVSYVFTDLYTDPQYEQWTLQGETGLDDVTWTVQLIDQADTVQDQQAYDGAVFNQSIDIETDTAEVRVEVTGEVPAIGNWSYADGNPFLFAEFRLARQGGTSAVIQTFDETTRYTDESRQARNAIESARTAISEAGGHEDAENTLSSAISAYNAGNFQNAVNLANQAEETAQKAQQGQEQRNLLLMGAGVVVLIAIVIGVVFWYRSRQTTSKL